MKVFRSLKWAVLGLTGLFLLCGSFASAGERKGVLKQWLLKRMEDKAAQVKIDAVPGTIDFGGRKRSYFVHAPRTWNGKDPLPVVFLFHGGGGNARQALDNYGLIAKADEAGFLLVAPNGTGPSDGILLTWNVGFGWGEAQKVKADDLGFVRALIEKLAGEFPLDRARLFATGMSNGAFLCHRLAAQADTPFAAIAPVVGSLGGKAVGEPDLNLPPTPEKPVAVLIINGLLDKSVPIQGGLQEKAITDARILTSASATVDFWVKANGCDPVPDTGYNEQQQATGYRYRNPTGPAEVVVYVLHNQGHAWPGATSVTRKKADPPSQTFPGNDIIWEFFSQHPRRR